MRECRYLDADRLDLNGIDLAGLSREDVLAALTDAALEAYEDAAEFYSPDQPRDWRGRWTSGGGGSDGGQSVPTHAERGQLRQASMAAVRDYVKAGGQPSQVENEQLAAHLARLTVDQLHAVKAEHGLKASGKDKAALVGKLAERFRAHRQTQAPAGKRALEEAVRDKPGFHNVREVVGGHAVTHGPTGSQVRADHAGTRFDVLTSGSTLHSSHATAAAAVKAAEASNRFGTGQSTAEEESRARHEAIANAQKRAAAGADQPGGHTFRIEAGGVLVAHNIDPALVDPKPPERQVADEDRSLATAEARARAMVPIIRRGEDVYHLPVPQYELKPDGRFQVYEGNARTLAYQMAGKKIPHAVIVDSTGRPLSQLPKSPAGGEKKRRKPAGFSVQDALSPEEAEERAALRRVESYADRENARLRAVREGVRA